MKEEGNSFQGRPGTSREKRRIRIPDRAIFFHHWIIWDRVKDFTRERVNMKGRGKGSLKEEGYSFQGPVSRRKKTRKSRIRGGRITIYEGRRKGLENGG